MKIAIALALSLIGTMAISNVTEAQDARSRYEKILETNTLDRQGKTPFHIKISFQLYDLDGRPSDTGDVEEWWAAPGQSKVVVEAASLGSTGPEEFNETLKMDPRERYFIRWLLGAELHPVPWLPTDHPPLITTRKFGATSLDCLSIPQDSTEGSGRSPMSFCVDPGTEALRIDLEGKTSATARNGITKFQGTAVSFETEIAYSRRVAVAGKVTLLEAFDASKAGITLSAPAPELPKDRHVTAGKIKLQVPPIYPDYARATHQSATVVLNATISKEGRVKQVVPLASPDMMFTQAAVDAVKQWRYEPYLLNGQPVDLETVIDINFFSGDR